MFGPAKKQTDAPKKNGVDVLIKKLSALPPAIDLIVAAVVGGYSFVAIYVDNSKFIGLICILLGLTFALLGIAALSREMRAFKQVESKTSPEALRALKTPEFEKYLMALFSLEGYEVRTAIDDLHRQDDADLIATKKKETILIQFNHWDEDTVGTRPIQSLQKAAAALRATQCIAITLGRFSADAVAWANRKGVILMTGSDLVAMANRLTGKAAATTVNTESSTQPDPEQTSLAPASDRRRFLVVDFLGIGEGLALLEDLLQENPTYHVLASTLPVGQTIDDVRDGLSRCTSQLVGEIASSLEGRYFAIQKYLQTTPEGRQAVWLAVDSEPRRFPESCLELVAMNPAFGFDASVAQRLREAMNHADRRAAAVA
jgi:restriction system protein